MIVLSAMLVAACTGHAGTTATGGSATASGTCSAPESLAGCGTCAKQSDCETCASMIDQDGVTTYNALLDCIDCSACYTTCAGSMDPHCTGAPSTTDACDTGATDPAACGTCQTCATKVTCASALTACKAIPRCVDLVKNLYTTCSSLPI